MNRAVFLDRDNTIIPNDGDLGDPAEVKLLQGAATAIASMRGLGFKIVVVSNQGGVARGRYSETDVDATHARLAELLKQQANGALVDRFYYCPFHPEGTVPRYRKEHPWRKPQPGMLLAAADDLKLELPMCWMVGDQARDIEAGKRAGARTIRIAASGHDEDAETRADFVARNLVEAARIIAQHLRPDLTLGPANTDENTGNDPAPVTSTSGGSTFPAMQKTGVTLTSAAPHRQTPPRPFKPWSIQPTTPSAGPAESQPAEAPAPAAAEAPVRPAAPPRAEPIAPAAVTATAAAAATTAPHEPADIADEPTPAEPHHQVPHLLQQILRHMKHTQADRGDWTLFKTIALGLAQPLAGVCALLAIMNTANLNAVIAWLLGAVFLQLVVLTMLHLHDHD